MDAIRIPVIYEEDTSGLSKAAAETAKLQKQTEEFQKTQKQAFDESAKSVNGLAEGLQGAGAEMADFEATTKDANNTNNAFKGIVRENIRGLSLFGQNLGEIIDGLKAKQLALKGVTSGLGGASGALRIFKVALISTGIGALIVALGSLAVFFTKTEEGTNKLAQAMAGFGAGANVVIKRIAELGSNVESMIEKFARANPELAKAGEKFNDLAKFGPILGPVIEGLKIAFSGLATEIGEAANKAIELEKANQKLADAERALAVEASARLVDIQKNKALADDELKGYNARISASQKASGIEQGLKQKEIALAKEALRIIQEQNKEKGILIKPEEQDAEAQAIIRVNELKAAGANQERLDLNKTQALLRQQQREIQKLAEEEKKRQEQRLKIEAANRQTFLDLQNSLAKQINDEEQLASNEKERLEFQRANALESLNLAEQELIARAKFLKQEDEIAKIQTDFARLRALTAERFEKEITKFVEEEQAKQLKAREEVTDEYLSKQKQLRDNRLKFISEEQELDELRIDAIKKSGNEELTLEQFKEDAKLRLLINSLKRQRQVFLETDTTGQGTSLFEVEKIDLEIAAIEDKLLAFNELPILARIKEKFKSLFNLSDEDVEAIGEQISAITENVFAGLQSLNDAELTQQQRIVDARQENVNELQRQLDEELRLKEQGVANNSDLLQTQLNAETELLKKEEEKRLALEKKAAQLRLRQEALQTASNIALSITKVIAAESGKGLLGIITAASAIASIFALIAKGKAQAAELSAPPKLRKGAKLEGATHEHGGIPLIADGQHYEAEHGEWLIGTKPSKEHDTFLSRLNDNEFQGHDLNKYVDFSSDFFKDPKGMIGQLAPQFDIPIVPDVIADILPEIRKTVAASHEANAQYDKAIWTAAMGEYFSRMEGGLSRVEKAIAEQPIAIPITEAGYLIKQKRGNATSINIYDPPKRNTQK